MGEQKEERENKEDVHEEDEEIDQQEGSSQPGVEVQPERDSVSTPTGPGQALGQLALFRRRCYVDTLDTRGKKQSLG